MAVDEKQIRRASMIADMGHIIYSIEKILKADRAFKGVLKEKEVEMLSDIKLYIESERACLFMEMMDNKPLKEEDSEKKSPKVTVCECDSKESVELLETLLDMLKNRQ